MENASEKKTKDKRKQTLSRDRKPPHEHPAPEVECLQNQLEGWPLAHSGTTSPSCPTLTAHTAPRHLLWDTENFAMKKKNQTCSLMDQAWCKDRPPFDAHQELARKGFPHLWGGHGLQITSGIQITFRRRRSLEKKESCQQRRKKRNILTNKSTCERFPPCLELGEGSPNIIGSIIGFVSSGHTRRRKFCNWALRRIWSAERFEIVGLVRALEISPQQSLYFAGLKSTYLMYSAG